MKNKNKKDTNENIDIEYNDSAADVFDMFPNLTRGIREYYPEPTGPFDPKNPGKNCTQRHPPLPINVNGRTADIYGSSCSSPIIDYADVYVALDTFKLPVYEWEQPWNRSPKEKREHIRLPVEDMYVPLDTEEYDQCVDYVISRLAKGDIAHVGCMAGHGRTGTFLSAVVQKTMGEELKDKNISAIDYVRDNYCAKSVETVLQVLYLYANYDVAIPKREEKVINQIKEVFEKEMGVSLDTIIEQGEFMDCLDDIETIELYVDRLNNPQRYTKPAVNKNNFAKGTTNWQQEPAKGVTKPPKI